VAAGYPGDGFRIGNFAAVESEGGTNTIPYTYISNIVIDGFTFTRCRIGVWAGYAKDFLIQNIRANSTAAVACGNDAYDDCFNFKIKNITQLSWSLRNGGEDFYAVGIYRCQLFSIENVQQLEGMSGPPNASVINIDHSYYFSVTDCIINNETKIVNGISILGCQYFSVTNCTAIQCKSGFVTYPEDGVTDQFGTFANNSAISCTNGIQVFSGYTTFRDMYTKNCTYDLALQSAATLNVFDSCWFNPGGLASIYEEIPGGNNGINLQTWRNCKTGNTPLGIEGNTSAYFGGAKTAFSANQITPLTNATGDGTYAVIPAFLTEEYDYHGDFNHATGTFTAPIDGMYQFTLMAGSSSAHLSFILALSINSATNVVTGTAGLTDNSPVWLQGTKVVRLTRGSVVKMQVQSDGGAKDVTVGAYLDQVSFSGLMIEG
jgi:hypothetical protein